MSDAEKIEEYRDALRTCVLAARLLAGHDIPKLLSDIEHADSFGPVLDPTLWRAKHKAMSEDREVFEAALALRAIGQRMNP
jgi:tRNA U34 5-methylaminomethyl-2-thiouridine-forming methyltransferase MnmC